MNEKLLSIAEQFAIEGKIASINALGEGFINDTYVVETEGDAPNYILQRKNHIVFPDVPGMMDNILAVTEHIKRKVADPMRETLTVVPAKDGKLYVQDGENFWAVCLFIPDTASYDRADSQLLDLGDGRIMLAFIADDAARTDKDRTALMYSIYDRGTWSKPVTVQNDGTADFEPNLCDAGDKVLISWTSRAPETEYASETEFLTTLEVYTTTLDKDTLALGEIERLTEDSFYDSAPVGIYDDVSGDYVVYYLKSDVGEDFATSVSPTTNESVIVYMLYDAAEGKWARDYYYDNEVESEEAEDVPENEEAAATNEEPTPTAKTTAIPTVPWP